MAKIMNKMIEKWWNKYANFYQAHTMIPTESAHYGPFSPNENELRLLGIVKDKKILELGCGGGQCSIAFAKQGAYCTAVDFSTSQLRFANNLAKKMGVKIDFIKADIQKFKFKKTEKFDIVFSSFALPFISDLDACFKNVSSVLNESGVFVFSMEHPFYSIISHEGKIGSSYYKTGKRTEWDTDDVFRTDKYTKELKKIPFVIYHRKISDIYSSLCNAGFKVDRIIEPNTFSQNDPWVKMYSLDVTSLIGPTVIFCAKKIK